MTVSTTGVQQRLAGKVIIVTGAGSVAGEEGTGSAMAILFARHGATVCVLDSDADRAATTLAAIESEGARASAAVADVTDGAACQRIADEVRERHGHIDGLVNNVGIAGGAHVDDVDEETWDRVMAVNVKSVLLMSRAVLPTMAEQGGGAILNIASIAGLLPNGIVAYSSSKAAMISLTRELAVGFGRQGVRANVICPGHLVAPMTRRHKPPEELELRRRVGPLNVEGTPWDVAWAALYLMSDEARYVTGANLPVDGGVTVVAPMTARRFLND